MLGQAENIPEAEIQLITEDTVYSDGSMDDLEAKIDDAADNIAMLVQKDFATSRDSRLNAQEEIMLSCERAYRNKYDMASQNELSTRNGESGDSTVWVPYTRTKINIAVAKTYEKILNTTANPWTVYPDAITPYEKRRNEMQVKQAEMSGRLQESPADALAKLNEFDEKNNRETCETMEKEIAQQMNVGNVFNEVAKTILQQHYLGTGAAKFEIGVRRTEKWIETQDGQWELKEKDYPFPRTKFKSLFDLFFDPYALNVQQSRYLIERHMYQRGGLLDLREDQDFNVAKIKQLISDNPNGNHINLDYETVIRGINEQDQNERGSEGYYDVLEYWGAIAGDKLIDYGFDIPGLNIDPTGSYNMECWVCGNVTIKLQLNPHAVQRIPYFVVPYQENTHTIYASGIAEDLFGVQDTINSVTRAAIDNAAFSHAPITEINVDMLKSGEQPPDVLRPRQIFLREGGDPKEEMVRFYQPTENSSVLHNVYQMFSQIGTDVTGISSSTEESLPAANSPNMAVSMSMTQKNILQRTIVGNIDNYLIKPMIEMYYNFNMQWSEKPEIKCAAHVVANGVTSIIAKEMRSQQLMAFAQMTMNPQDATIVDRKEVLEQIASSMDHQGERFVLSDRQIAENQKKQSEQQQQAVMAEQQGVIDQIKTENQGELEQSTQKSSADMRKQKFIERSKMMQLAAKEDIDITAQEFDLIKQMRMKMQEQQFAQQNASQAQQNNRQNITQTHYNNMEQGAQNAKGNPNSR